MAKPEHDIARALNWGLMDPLFAAALKKSWSYDSCWDGCKDFYSKNNPSCGNCLVSVLALWAARGFKGTIVPGKVDEPGNPRRSWHFRLRVDGVYIDPTWQQFKEGSTFEALDPGHAERAEVIQGSFLDLVEEESLIERLRTLLSTLELSDYPIDDMAEEIVARAQEHIRFTPVAAPAAPAPTAV